MSRTLPTILAATGLVLSCAMWQGASADDKSQDYVDAVTKKLLLQMDADQNGKVSKKEFLDFMSAEFDRLDVNKDGELDTKELNELHVHINQGHSR